MFKITLIKRKTFAWVILLVMTSTHLTWSQAPTTLPYSELTLNDMSAFKKTAGNWQIAGDVNCDRNKNEAILAKPGQGILVNIPSEKNKDNLFTNLEHGDIELELDFMMAKGSNSGIYLQGLYELQLYDSWGTKKPIYQDCGGIYKRRDAQGNLSEGKAPRVNVTKAPGLWQHFKIIFHAPRFDAQGKKISNARFLRVEQNGVTIHENVELSGPTGGAAFPDERKVGPLMIQGDHGPVAFRNFRYKLYEQNTLKFEHVQLSYYEGDFQNPDQLDNTTPKSQTMLEDFVPFPKDREGNFGVKLSGQVTVPKSGNYLFNTYASWITNEAWLEGKKSGAIKFKIGDVVVLENKGIEKHTIQQAQLKEGTYPFSFSFFQYGIHWLNDLTIGVEGPGISQYSLIPEKYSTVVPVSSPIFINPEKDPIIHRSFLNHRGKKKTICVSVGDPGNIHYSVDLKQGALLQVWKSDFADLTPMWHERGEDQLAIPSGSLIDFQGSPSVAFLGNETESWPDSAFSSNAIKFNKYQLDKNGRPTFYYSLGNGISITDFIMPQDEDKILTRELSVTGSQKVSNLYCRIAEGKSIEKQEDGSYSVNDKAYYIFIKEPVKGKPVVRNTNNGQELLFPVNRESNQSKIVYSIIW